MGEVEVRAAHNVLEACAQTETIEKVVLTSSATAMIWGQEHDKDSAASIDERHWTDINFCRKFKVSIFIMCFFFFFTPFLIITFYSFSK